MNYSKIVPAKFIERENRFVARVSMIDSTDVTGPESDRHHHPESNHYNVERTEETVDQTEETEVRVHVKNTGRCKELLIPGATVYLEDHVDKMGARKYRYDLIAVEKVTPAKAILINMDSQAPNKVVGEALSSGKLDLIGMDGSTSESNKSRADVQTTIRPETTFGSSRFDFYLEAGQHRAFIEVKGVTLEDDGVARFPDAPTERGVRHIRELEQAAAEGYEAYIIFVIQMKGIDRFEPNDDTHPQFGEALRHAEKAGVSILAYDCIVEPDRLTLDQPIHIEL